MGATSPRLKRGRVHGTLSAQRLEGLGVPEQSEGDAWACRSGPGIRGNVPKKEELPWIDVK